MSGLTLELVHNISAKSVHLLEDYVFRRALESHVVQIHMSSEQAAEFGYHRLSPGVPTRSSGGPTMSNTMWPNFKLARLFVNLGELDSDRLYQPLLSRNNPQQLW